MHEYFYGAQSSTYSFIRVPTVLFTDDQYKYVSAEAKVLYGLLLARMDLSAKNGWLDDQGRVYIICTLSEIMEKLNCADNKATKLMNELEDKCGLIERKRQGLGKPNLIYVKNFLSVDNAVESRFKSRDNHDSGVAEITIPDTSKSRPSNKDQKYIDLRYTENPIYPGWDTDGMSEYERYKEWFRRQLEIDILILDHPTEKETLEGILDILAETCSSNKKEIRIAGDDKPKEVVKSRLMKLDSMHIQYVLDCLKENTSDVKNIKQYLLTSLFNAPVTISPYYQNRVNYEQPERVQKIPISDLKPFRNHPFRVVDDESMIRTTESISMFGVLTPLLARPLSDGSLEIISGHRRARAAEAAGLTEVPVIVRKMTDDEAVVLMVDSNLQRENILPSERAFAYKMKLEAMKRQGERTDLQEEGTSRQVVGKLEAADVLGQDTGESGRQVQRFIRLTNLIPELLDMVDQRQISFNPAVELSYLKPEEQKNLIEAMDFTQASPSLSQAMRLKKLSQEGNCSLDDMCEILGEVKKGDLERVAFKSEQLRKYFPKSYTPKQMSDVILKLLDQWQKKRQRDKAR